MYRCECGGLIIWDGTDQYGQAVYKCNCCDKIILQDDETSADEESDLVFDMDCGANSDIESGDEF